MPFPRLVALTSLVMLAFAGNSILCRLALKNTTIDPASFTTLRVASGALVLALLTRSRGTNAAGRGNWPSAVALLAYAAGFSFAYVSLPASTGALLLFGAVQVTMIGYGVAQGERLCAWQLVGLASALGGLVYLLAPGLAAPPWFGSTLMLGAPELPGESTHYAAAACSILPKRPLAISCAVSLAALLSLLMYGSATMDRRGLVYAVTSGALTSGIGYMVWYTVLPVLKATSASIVQLSVPAIAALGGVIFLGEPLTTRLWLSSLAILGGILLVLLNKLPAGGEQR